MFESVDAKAASASTAAKPDAGRSAQHHLPDVRLSAGLRDVLLPQWRHLLHHQDRRVYPLQLRVSRVIILLLL